MNRMRKRIAWALLATMLLAVCPLSVVLGEGTPGDATKVSAQAVPSEQPTPGPELTGTPTEQATPVPDAQPAPTAEATSAPSEQPTPNPEMTSAPSGEATPNPEMTSAPSTGETPSPEVTSLPGEEATPSPEMTSAPGGEATPVPGAEQTPGAEATSVPGESATPQPGTEPTAVPDAQVTPSPELTPTPSPEPTPTPSPVPTKTPQEQPFVTDEQAWTRLYNGTYLAGNLGTVILAVRNGDGPGPVYVAGEGAMTLDIPANRIESIRILPDPVHYGSDYQVIVIQREDEDMCTVFVIPNGADIDEYLRQYGLGGPPSCLYVTAEGLTGDWSNTPPVFLLGSDRSLGENYVFTAILDEEKFVQISGRSTYTPPEGEHTVTFAIADRSGDLVAGIEPSKSYVCKWDATSPEGPTVEGLDEKTAVIHASDALSGVAEISLDNGKTWQPFDEEKGYTLHGTSASVLWPESIVVRDRAGNSAALDDWYEFISGASPEMLLILGGGGGGTTVRHVRETADYSLVNYNALDLDFSDAPAEELIAGDTVLPLSMTSVVGDDHEAGLFTAHMEPWKVDKEDERKTPNALVLTADGDSDINTWTFSGETYRLLYNSGVDYLVFESGGYMTAVSTAGFTGGTAYAKLKAGGVSTKKFSYTISQDGALRETELFVEVDGQTYRLGEEQNQPMYRYDVVIGSTDMMKEPFRSYLPDYGGDVNEAVAAARQRQEADAAQQSAKSTAQSRREDGVMSAPVRTQESEQALQDILIFGRQGDETEEKR